MGLVDKGIIAFSGRKIKFPIKCNYRVPPQWLTQAWEFSLQFEGKSLIIYETSGKM
jgi:hypothetical protein